MARAAGGAARLEQIRTEYFAARDALDVDEPGDAEGEWVAAYHARIDRVWRAVEEWSCSFAERSPDGDPMAAWIESLDPVSQCGEAWSPCMEENHLEFWSVRLDGDGSVGWAIAFNYPGPGTFSVVVRDPRTGACTVGFRAGTFDVPGRFDADGAACLAGALGTCPVGWLGFSLEPLPPNGRGDPRFWADGAALGGGSCEHYRQASLWTWSANGAVLDALVWYGESCDHSQSSRYDPSMGMLRLITKEFPQSFFTPGSSPQPEGEHTLRITPWGADDGGVRWLVPELELVDRFVAGVTERRSVDEIASDRAVRWLQRYLLGGTEPIFTADAPFKRGIDLGTGGARVIERNGPSVEVCVAGDDISPDRLQFTITEKDGKRRVTGVRVSTCDP